MTIAMSILLFILAAIAEIGGAWLVWQAVREDRGWWWWAGLGVAAPGNITREVARSLGVSVPTPYRWVPAAGTVKLRSNSRC